MNGWATREIMQRHETSIAWRLNAIALWALIATCALFGGLILRDWTWKMTEPIRFHGDISNALNIGRATVMAGVVTEPGKPPRLPDWAGLWNAYLGRYDAEYNRFAHRENVPSRRYSVDYPPGRLLIASAWAKHVMSTPPPGQTLPRGLGVGYSDDLATPLRWVNIGHELAAAIGMFFLVRIIFRRSGRRMFSSEALAMMSALLVWFNPALILNAHGWPQWESWVLPYFLWGAYFAIIDRWLLTGMLLAAGAMLKGQVLLIAPLFPLWALFSFRIGGLLRVTAGFAFTAALQLSPWLIRSPLPAIWAIGATLLIALIALSLRHRSPTRCVVPICILLGWIAAPWLRMETSETGLIAVGIAVFVAASAALLWPGRPLWTVIVLSILSLGFAAMMPETLAAWIGNVRPSWLTIAMPRWTYSPLTTMPDAFAFKIAGVAVCGAIAWIVLAGRKFILPVTMASFAILVFLAGNVFNGSFAWKHVGFQTERYPTMFSGIVSNLPAILQEQFRLSVDTPVTDFGLLPESMLLKPFLQMMSWIGLALCALALIIQLRRRDPNALIAFAAAWTLLYALLPQMHERYLTWAAVTTAVLATRGVGGFLAHVVIVAIQFAMMFLGMVGVQRGALDESLRPWIQLCAGLHPAIGYVVITIAFVLLCWSFRRSVPRAVVHRRAAVPQRLLSSSRPPAEAEPISTTDTSPASV